MKTFNYEAMLAESHELQKDAFVGLMIDKVCKHCNLNMVEWRHGSVNDDKRGGDVVLTLANGKEVFIDLKIAKGERAQRIPLEIERGRNQKAMPWSLDATKGHLILWLNIQLGWCLVASRKRLAAALLSQNNDTRALLLSAKRYDSITHVGSDKFCSPVHLIDRFRFGIWLKQQAIGTTLAHGNA